MLNIVNMCKPREVQVRTPGRAEMATRLVVQVQLGNRSHETVVSIIEDVGGHVGGR